MYKTTLTIDDKRQIANEVYYDNQDNDRPMCQHKGCNESSIQCEIPGGYYHETESEYPETYEYFCSEHAAENGFCCCCGCFIAGWRDFSSYCENCEDQISESEDDYDDDYYCIDYERPY